MKNTLFVLLFFTKPLQAQKIYKFENDTLYTSCGYKIYKGQEIISNTNIRQSNLYMRQYSCMNMQKLLSHLLKVEFDF